MVSVCLPSDALSQHLPSYLGFFCLGRGVSLTLDMGYLLPWTWGISSRCSSKAHPLLLTLEEEYLLTAAPPNLEGEIAPLSPPAPAQPPLLGHGVAPLSRCPWPQAWGSSSQPFLRSRSLALSATTPDLRGGVALLGSRPWSRMWGSSSIKRNTFESVLMRWMNLKPIAQGEASQNEEDKYHVLVHQYGI